MRHGGRSGQAGGGAAVTYLVIVVIAMVQGGGYKPGDVILAGTVAAAVDEAACQDEGLERAEELSTDGTAVLWGCVRMDGVKL